MNEPDPDDTKKIAEINDHDLGVFREIIFELSAQGVSAEQLRRLFNDAMYFVDAKERVQAELWRE